MAQSLSSETYRCLTYLASPYTHAEWSVRSARFFAVNKCAAKLMAKGKVVFSPISHSHVIACAGNLPAEWAFWEKIDRKFLSVSAELIVLRLDGWRESVGVQAEIKIAEEMGMPISYVDPE